MMSHSSNFPEAKLMPVLFAGHGSPMNAIEENIFVDAFRGLAKQIPMPKAILAISAHWLTQGTQLTADHYPRTIHDFYGFPDALYKIKYPAKGSQELVEETHDRLDGITAVSDDFDWGLDHGTWSVLRHIYPEANVPVVQLSLDRQLSPVRHYELAKALCSLRSKGILIFASGNLVHNLSKADFGKINELDYGYDWAFEAQQTINTWIENRDIQSLTRLNPNSEAVRLAISTWEHYLPLFYALGTSTKEDHISFFNDRLVGGSLSMTSLLISPDF